MKPRRSGLVLIGMRRAGKSLIGARLAESCGRAFVDVDRETERLGGASCGELLRLGGERAFREIEARALKEALRSDGAVVATGGGTPLREDSRALIRAYGEVVYLRADAALLLARARSEEDDGERRPLLAGARVEDEIERLLAAREEVYRELATRVIDASAKVEVIVEQCAKLLNASGN